MHYQFFEDTAALEVAVGVQNLFDDRHPEFSDMLLQTAATESQRNYYVSVSYRY